MAQTYTKSVLYTCKARTDFYWGDKTELLNPTIYFTTSYEEAVESLTYFYGEFIYEVEVLLSSEDRVDFEYSSGLGDVSPNGQWGAMRSPSRSAYPDAIWVHCNVSSFLSNSKPRLVADAVCLGRWA